MYRIREADGHDEDIAETLTDLHRLTFFDGAPIPEFYQGHWWLASHEDIPIAFAGLVPSTRVFNAGYFCRVGVLRKHRGRALQLRLMRALELRARRNGWSAVVSDTTENLASAITLSARATGCTSRHIHGAIQTHFIGENISDKSRMLGSFGNADISPVASWPPGSFGFEGLREISGAWLPVIQAGLHARRLFESFGAQARLVGQLRTGSLPPVFSGQGAHCEYWNLGAAAAQPSFKLEPGASLLLSGRPGRPSESRATSCRGLFRNCG